MAKVINIIVNSKEHLPAIISKSLHLYRERIGVLSPIFIFDKGLWGRGLVPALYREALGFPGSRLMGLHFVSVEALGAQGHDEFPGWGWWVGLACDALWGL